MPVPPPDDELLSPAPRTDRADRLAFVVASLVTFVVYLLSLSLNVNLGDSGVLTTSAFYGGVAGPPGQPVWTLYSWVFTKILPFSNIAWRVAVGSAVAGALLCGFVAMIISYGANAIFKDSKFIEKLTRPDWDKLRIGGGVAASLVLGFNGLFWSQAVQVEISSLSYLIFTIILWLLTRVSFYSGGRGMLCLAFFVFGLLLTSSQELLIALPGFTCLVMFSRGRLGRDLAIFVLPLAAALAIPNGWNANPWLEDYFTLPNWPMILAFIAALFGGGVAIIITRGLGSHWKSVLVAAFGLISGLAFYLYLPIAAMTTPPMNWGYPRTVEGFFHVIGRGQFERVQPTYSVSAYYRQLGDFLNSTGDHFGWVYLCIGAMGAVYLCRINRRGRRWVAGLAAVWFCVGLLMVGMLNPSSDRQSSELVSEFFGASYIILAVLLGLGLITIGAWITRPTQKL